MDNTIGNLSTIIKIISMTTAGWIITTIAATGYNLGIDAQTLASVIGAIIGLILAYIDAKYPNTFTWLGNNKPIITTEEQVLNDEYECGDDDGGC
jgi:hypothetical protein